MLTKCPPYKLYKYGNRYLRKIVYNPPLWNPAVVLKTTVEAQKLFSLIKEKNFSLNACLVKALAIALTRHPRLNYLPLWGDMIWAGDHTKVGVVREEQPLEDVFQFFVMDAETKSLAQIKQEFQQAKDPSGDNASLMKAMDRFPNLFYQVGKRTGLFAKSLASVSCPIMLTNLNVPGVDEMISAGVPHAMLVCIGLLNDKKLPISLSFNHQLANARAVAVYLAEVKAILENTLQLVMDKEASSVGEIQK